MTPRSVGDSKELLDDRCLSAVTDVRTSGRERPNREVRTQRSGEGHEDRDARLAVTREDLRQVTRIDLRRDGELSQRNTGVGT
jgi:hypothetical protein